RCAAPRPCLDPGRIGDGPTTRRRPPTRRPRRTDCRSSSSCELLVSVTTVKWSTANHTNRGAIDQAKGRRGLSSPVVQHDGLVARRVSSPLRRYQTFENSPDHNRASKDDGDCNHSTPILLGKLFAELEFVVARFRSRAIVREFLLVLLPKFFVVTQVSRGWGF